MERQIPPAFPRMSHEDAAAKVSELSARPLSDVAGMATVDVANATYYQMATNRVGEAELLAIQSQIRALATQHGYPAPQARGRSLVFDQALTVLLVSAINILPADAADEGVWSFLTLNVCPDVALWRFPNNASADGSVRENYERLVGKPRNVFRRSWWRGYVLTPELSSQLLEDESVGIMERPSIGGSPRLARDVARVHLEGLAEGNIRNRQDVLRDAVKRIRRRMGQISIHAISDVHLSSLVRSAFDETRLQVASSSGSQSTPATEVDIFREAAAGVWPLIEPNVVEVDWVRMTELMRAVREYRDTLGDNRDLARKIVDDLEKLVASWDYYSPEGRAVVNGAVCYFLNLDDDIPDNLRSGLDDDDEVIGAAYRALNQIRD